MKQLLPIILLASASCFGQQFSTDAVFHGMELPTTQCLSNQERQELHAQIRDNILQLEQEGRLPERGNAQVLFDWPLKAATGFTDPGYQGITGYVDHDPNYPNSLSNHNCGTITYDTQSGYNHQGTDYYSWPFAWNKMDSGLVEIIAGAAGTIINKTDGNFDRSCSFNSNQWNYVAVLHSDNSYAWYGHMKNGSVTTKGIGQSVAQGEYLGLVGSSGNSTGPHLHFEVYDSTSSLIDPYAGTCNNMNSTSWWSNQHPEIDPAINRIRTNIRPPDFSTCPNPEIQNEEDYFWPQDSVNLMTYYRHLNTGDTVDLTVYHPDNSIAYQWQWISSWNFYRVAWMYYWFTVSSNDPVGMWRFKADYKGQSYEHNFYVGIVSGYEDNPFEQPWKLVPNPTSGTFQVHGSMSEKVEVYDLLGNCILSGPVQQQIDLSSYPTGVYLVRVDDRYQKLVRQ